MLKEPKDFGSRRQRREAATALARRLSRSVWEHHATPSRPGERG